jgi:hypothetical protein
VPAQNSWAACGTIQLFGELYSRAFGARHADVEGISPAGPKNVCSSQTGPATFRYRQIETIRGRSSDVVLCPDVVPFVDHRFDCCDLPQRGLIHHGAGKASPVIRPCTFRARGSLITALCAPRSKRCTISRAGPLCAENSNREADFWCSVVALYL